MSGWTAALRSGEQPAGNTTARPARPGFVGSTSIGRPSFGRLKTLATARNQAPIPLSTGRPLASATASAGGIGATRYWPVAPLMPLRTMSSSFMGVSMGEFRR